MFGSEPSIIELAGKEVEAMTALITIRLQVGSFHKILFDVNTPAGSTFILGRRAPETLVAYSFRDQETRHSETNKKILQKG